MSDHFYDKQWIFRYWPNWQSNTVLWCPLTSSALECFLLLKILWKKIAFVKLYTSGRHWTGGVKSSAAIMILIQISLMKY
jgi:hypothetical protein